MKERGTDLVKGYLEKNKKNVLLFSIFLLTSLVFFGIFAKMELAVDSYCYFMYKNEETMNSISQGRILKALLFLFVFKLPFSESAGYIISFIIAILSITFSGLILYKSLEEDIKNSFINYLITTLIVMNPFTIELFLFFEKGTMNLGILFSVLAFCEFKKYLKDSNKKNLILSLVYLVFGNLSYQGVTALFLGLSSIYCVKNSKDFKKFIVNNVIMGIIFMISTGIDLLITKIFAYSRVSSSINLIESFKYLKEAGLLKMFKSFNIMPGYFFIICIVLGYALIGLTLCFNKEKINKKLIKGLAVVYVTIVIVFSAIAPQLILSKDNMWFTPRATYIFGSILGLIELVFVVLISDQTETLTKKLKYFLIVLNIVFLIVQFNRFISIGIDRYKLNCLDRERALKIGQIIETYEKENNTKVTKICIYKDTKTQGSYDGIDISTEFNLSPFAIDWSDYVVINYYNKSNLIKEKGNEEIENYFKDKNWNSFSEEQVILKDDTIHLCIY